MKKNLLLCLALAAALALAACTAKEDPAPTPTPLPDDVMNQPATPPEGEEAVDPGMTATPEDSAPLPVDEELSALVDTLYAAHPVELMMPTTSAVDLSDESWCRYHTGLEAADAAKVDAAVVSESMTGSQAYSLVLLRVKDEADAQAVADAVLENVQMNKWVCVMADKARVATFGDKVLFVMSNTELTDADALMDAAPEALGVTFAYENAKDADTGDGATVVPY